MIIDALVFGDVEPTKATEDLEISSSGFLSCTHTAHSTLPCFVSPSFDDDELMMMVSLSLSRL
jgi:hypothetical protein